MLSMQLYATVSCHTIVRSRSFAQSMFVQQQLRILKSDSDIIFGKSSTLDWLINNLSGVTCEWQWISSTVIERRQGRVSAVTVGLRLGECFGLLSPGDGPCVGHA